MKFTDSFAATSVMTGALRQNDQKESARKATSMFLRPTQEGKHYRFRLINTLPDENFVQNSGLRFPRDFPFILRYVHNVWIKQPDEKAPNGVRNILRTIPCPQSDYIKANSNLTKSACPICSAGNQAYASYRDSGFKNMVAKERMSACRNSFEALIPVYVISNPDWDRDNGTVKILQVRQDDYEILRGAIEQAVRQGLSIWNANAVDLYISYGKTTKTIPASKNRPAFSYEGNGIIKVGFTPTTHNIENLPALVEEVEFDRNWFTIPTLDELQEFYGKYLAVGSDVPNDIPDDIPNDVPASHPAPAVKPVPVKPVVETPAVKPAPAPEPAFEKPTPAPAPVVEPVDTGKNAANLDADIDSFIASLPGLK